MRFFVLLYLAAVAKRRQNVPHEQTVSMKLLHPFDERTEQDGSSYPKLRGIDGRRGIRVTIVAVAIVGIVLFAVADVH